MNDQVHEYYLEAGQIAGKIAFPCNISINEIASHFTPQDDLTCFKAGDVVNYLTLKL